jgi:hypothetical protein
MLHLVMGIHTGYGFLIHSELGWEFGVCSLSIWDIYFLVLYFTDVSQSTTCVLYTFESTSRRIHKLSYLWKMGS